MVGHRLFIVLVLASLVFLMGNAPAPYYACQGKKVGDPCTYGYGSSCSSSNQVCALSTSFTDNPNTPDLNEQLICVTR